MSVVTLAQASTIVDAARIHWLIELAEQSIATGMAVPVQGDETLWSDGTTRGTNIAMEERLRDEPSAGQRF